MVMITYLSLLSLFFVSLRAFKTTKPSYEIVKRPKQIGMTLDISRIPGQLPPVGFFDPLGLSKNVSPAVLKKWREAEIKHGRVAMLASIGLLTAESFHPLFGGQVQGPAAYHFQEIQNIFSPFWYLLLLSIGIVEGYGIWIGWESYDLRRTDIANLREDYIPGDLGFDPLGLKPLDFEGIGPEYREMRNKELSNGRLAMIGVAGMLIQEIVDKKTILEHFSQFGFRPTVYGQ